VPRSVTRTTGDRSAGAARRLSGAVPLPCAGPARLFEGACVCCSA
jgi:hypothetical protein